MWCVCFCRYNKYIKNLVRDMHRAQKNLSTNVTVDFACNYFNHKYDVVAANPCQTCYLTQQMSHDDVTDDEFHGMLALGAPTCDIYDVCVFQIAYILNKHFKAGEWGMHPRCGSVITCVINGRSLYARVVKFMKVEGDRCPGYASVSWFSEPTYVNRLCPRVTLDGREVAREVGGRVIGITDIDPSQVSIDQTPGDDNIYMIRDSRYDTIRN